MSQANVALVQNMYAAFGRGDIQAILGALHPDVTWTVQGPTWIPLFGKRKGRQQVAQFFQTLNEHFQVEQFLPREFIAEGDRVVVTGDEVARLRSTGKVINVKWAHVFGMKNGLIVTFQEYFDTCAAVEALREAAAAARA